MKNAVNKKPERVYRAVLECPIRSASIEFIYNSGDTVRQLKEKTASLWGTPTSGLERELNRNGGFYEREAWAIFCEASDGSYLPLHDDDELPTGPPEVEANAEVEEDLLSRWIRDHGLNWTGLVYERSLLEKTPVRFHFKGQDKSAGDYNTHFLALVAITGG